MPLGVFSKDDLFCRRRWRQIQYLADVFWKRWLSSYSPALQERQKWARPSRNFCVGDLVLVVDERVPRGQWPLDRIIGVHTGRDSLVRSAKIATKKCTLTRSIMKLCCALKRTLNENRHKRRTFQGKADQYL